MNDLDPTITAELQALEDALNGTPDADPALVALVEDVRATAAPMPLSLRTRLEQQAAAGFPRTRRRPALPAIRPLPALGALAAVIVALVVGTTALQNDRSPSPGTADQALSTTAAPEGAAGGTTGGVPSAKSVTPTQTAQAESATGAGAPAPSVAPALPGAPSDADATRGFGRKVERAVDLGLRVGRGQLEDAADGVVRVTQSLGGYVATSQVSARDSGGTADFTLRIPTAKLDRAIALLSRLGHVTRLDQSSQDITGSFVSVADRLKDARAERRALLRALGRATTAGQIAALRARLRANRSLIARLNGELDALRRRADLATIQVGIVARGKASVAPGGGGDHWSPGDAARDALRVLEVLAGVLLIALAVLTPVALLGGLGLLGARAARRRRREHALDAG